MVGLRAIKLLATYLDNPSNKEISVLQMKEWLSDPVASGNKTLQIIAATIFLYEDNVKEAFKVIKNGSNLEQFVEFYFIANFSACILISIIVLKACPAGPTVFEDRPSGPCPEAAEVDEVLGRRQHSFHALNSLGQPQLGNQTPSN